MVRDVPQWTRGALRTQPLKAGRGAKPLTMRVDLTQFAERYEASLLSLEQLTPHQRDVLERTRGKHTVEVRAAAGGWVAAGLARVEGGRGRAESGERGARGP